MQIIISLSISTIGTLLCNTSVDTAQSEAIPKKFERAFSVTYRSNGLIVLV
jgi:uncharacterized protein YejL (UPF0352 family)